MKSDAPSFNRGFKNGDNPEFGDDNLKGKLFLRQDCSVQSLPILFLYNQKHEASDLGKNASFFFFSPVEKVAFFPTSFPKLLLLQWNKSPSPACTGGAARWEQGLGDQCRFPCISLQCSHAVESRNDSEVKHCHEENISLACMWKLTAPGACKCIFVVKELVSQGLSQLWGAVRGGCWRGKGGLWTDPSIQRAGINGPGMLQL